MVDVIVAADGGAELRQLQSECSLPERRAGPAHAEARAWRRDVPAGHARLGGIAGAFLRHSGLGGFRECRRIRLGQGPDDVLLAVALSSDWIWRSQPPDLPFLRVNIEKR